LEKEEGHLSAPVGEVHFGGNHFAYFVDGRSTVTQTQMLAV
jgi:hypothetical protein